MTEYQASGQSRATLARPRLGRPYSELRASPMRIDPGSGTCIGFVRKPTQPPIPEVSPLALEDPQLDHLLEAAASTHRHRVALGFANALKSIHTAHGLTFNERQEVRATEAACNAADQAVTDYRANKF